MKKCAQCGELKPLDEFHKRTKAPDQRQRVCKVCNCQHGYEYRAKTRERGSPVSAADAAAGAYSGLDVQCMHATAPYQEMMALCEAFEQRIKS